MSKAVSSGMRLDEFAQLDPEAVAAQCGSTSMADDGLNPGDAGEKEATVADNDHPNGSRPTDETVGLEHSDPEASAENPDQIQEDSAVRKVPTRAFELVALLKDADPSLDDESGMALLTEILNKDRGEDQIPRVIGGASQFVPELLLVQVRSYIDSQRSTAVDTAEPGADHAAALPPFDQDATDMPQLDEGDDVGASDPVDLAAGQLEPNASSTDAPEQLDHYREALRPYLQAAVDARLSGDSEVADAALKELAGVMYDTGWLLYGALGIENEEEIEQYLFRLKKEKGQRVPESLTREQINADESIAHLAWFNRQALRSTAQVVDGYVTIQEELEGFTWPREEELTRRFYAQRSRNRGHSSTRTAAMPPPRPSSTDREEASTNANPPAPLSRSAADEASDSSDEAVGPPTQPVPVVRQTEGRRTVHSGAVEEPQRHVVQGGGRAAMRPAAKPRPVEEQAVDRSDQADRDASRGRTKSDESILASLPEDVVLMVMRQVAEDDNAPEHWAYRTPHEQREEVDRRLLLEYGQHTAA